MKGDLDVQAKTSSVSVGRLQKREPTSLLKRSTKLEGKTGSTMTKPVMGVEVTFTLEKITAGNVSKATMVWAENERDQELLDHFSVAHLIPSFKEFGQEAPAIGRKVNGVIEVADGSCRRFTSILTNEDFYSWIGDLTDEQMNHLSKIGNQYQPPSPYERGQKALRLLAKTGATKTSVAEHFGIDRKPLQRILDTASLPKLFIRCFTKIGELSGRAGQELFKAYEKQDNDQKQVLDELFAEWLDKKGQYSSEQLISMFKAAIALPAEKTLPQIEKLNMGATLTMKGKHAHIKVPNISEESKKKIAAYIDKVLADEALGS